ASNIRTPASWPGFCFSVSRLPPLFFPSARAHGAVMPPELPEPPTIRPATAADIAAITAIYADAVRHGTATFELEPPDFAEMLRRFAALSEAGFPYLVAEERAGVAGYAYAGPYRARPAYRFTVEDSLYLAPSARGRGIGSA